jgi:hypothetical protein
MSLIDRHSTPQNMACLAPTRYDQSLMVSAANDKALSPETSMVLSQRYGAGIISQDAFQKVIAVGRQKGSAYVDKLYRQGGVAAFEKSGDFAAVDKAVAEGRAKVSEQAVGESDYGSRIVALFNAIFGKPADKTECEPLGY